MKRTLMINNQSPFFFIFSLIFQYYCNIKHIVKATSVDEVGIDQIRVSPNPTKDIARVTFAAPLKNDVVLQLLATNGQVLTGERISAGTKSYDLDVSDRSSGIYFIRIIIGEEQRIYKLLKSE